MKLLCLAIAAALTILLCFVSYVQLLYLESQRLIRHELPSLEFFRDTLPPEAGRLIRDVTTMQDQLGALHDADVASGLIDEFIARQQKRRKKGDPDYEVPPGLAAYLEERQAAIRTIHADFNSTWATLQSPKWRARLAVVILA